MPKRRYIHLTHAQQAELEHILRTDPKPYRRERAAAILKVAAGHSPHWVAQQGLLTPRTPDCVYAWLNRYETEGVAGLTMRAGRGRKPAFSPST